MKIGIILVFASLVAGHPKQKTNRHSKILGGTQVDIKEFPHQLSLRYNGGHICGASILKADSILTAAHCVADTSPSSLSVRAGSTLHTSGGQEATVKEFFIHPYYSPSFNDDYDVSVVHLATPITIDHITTSPVKLPRFEPLEGTWGTVSGWGIDSSAGSKSDDLRSVSVPIIPRDVCKVIYKGGITSRMFCAGLPGKDACEGDRGGPLVTEDGQIGIYSWGTGCIDGSSPGVYTSVAHLEISSFIVAYE